jgi:hypothetical protein
MKLKLPKFTVHDVQTGAIIFVMAFAATLLKGGPVDKSLLISAASAGVGALIHTYLGKGA